AWPRWRRAGPGSRAPSRCGCSSPRRCTNASITRRGSTRPRGARSGARPRPGTAMCSSARPRSSSSRPTLHFGTTERSGTSERSGRLTGAPARQPVNDGVAVIAEAAGVWAKVCARTWAWAWVVVVVGGTAVVVVVAPGAVVGGCVVVVGGSVVVVVWFGVNTVVVVVDGVVVVVVAPGVVVLVVLVVVLVGGAVVDVVDVDVEVDEVVVLVGATGAAGQLTPPAGT